MRRIIKYLLPPFVIDLAKYLLRITGREPIEWEYIPQGWQIEQTDAKIKGWNVKSVLEAYKARWPDFALSLEKTTPFGMSSTTAAANHYDLSSHNVRVSYAYIFTLAAHLKSSISMLDWGGGIGHYYLFSQLLLPSVKIDYHCKDVPILSEYGQSLFPDAHFYTDESCLDRQYDLVLASGALHYSQDWVSTLKKLAKATTSYLYVTRLPIVHKAASFVVVQRPYKHNYDTEYLGWCFNREEFLSQAKAANLELVREFLIEDPPFIYRAPEQCEFRGYLFRVSGTA